jgi:hypothetical protein
MAWPALELADRLRGVTSRDCDGNGRRGACLFGTVRNLSSLRDGGGGDGDVMRFEGASSTLSSSIIPGEGIRNGVADAEATPEDGAPLPPEE